MKRLLIGIILFVCTCLAGCGVIDDAIDDVQKKDTITIMRTVGEAEPFTRTKTITDEEIIKRVRDAFEHAAWEEMPNDARSHPNYRIETYDIWIPDDSSFAEAQDIESKEYAKLTEEQSEVIIQLIIDAFH